MQGLISFTAAVMEKTFQPAYDFPQDSFLEDFFTHTFEKLPSDEEVTSKRYVSCPLESPDFTSASF